MNPHNYDKYDTHLAKPGEAIDSMRYDPGICDSGVLDIWYRPDRDEYDLYLETRDGTVLGYCYFNRGPTKSCCTYEVWVCISDVICG